MNNYRSRISWLAFCFDVLNNFALKKLIANKPYSRRHFIRDLSLSMGTVAVNINLACLAFEKNKKDKLGIALVGLGSYSGGQLAPALQETKDCYLAGIVTGTPSKEKEWARRYDIPEKNIFNYGNFDSIANNPDIHCVCSVAYAKKQIKCYPSDMGVYAIQGARYTTGEEPIFVTAREEKSRPEFFKEVDETIYFELEFPGGTTAKGISSFNKSLNHLKAKALNGWFELTRAYRYRGMAGSTSNGDMTFDANVNQQALQMDDFAACILQKNPTRVP